MGNARKQSIFLMGGVPLQLRPIKDSAAVVRGSPHPSQCLSNSTKMTTNTETAMPSSKTVSQSVNNQGRPRAARAAKYRHNMQQTNSTVTDDQVRVQFCCYEESKRKIISQDRVSVAKTLKVRCSQKQSAHLHIISSKKEKPYLQKKKSGCKYFNPICGRYNLYYNIYDIYRFLPINWSCLHLKKTFPPGFLFSSHETF